MKNVFLVTLLLLILNGCSSDNSSSQTADRYDTVVTSFAVEGTDLEYALPYPDRSIVALPEHLPEKVKMCVVDTATNISVLLLKLPSSPQNRDEAEEYVTTILKQDDPSHTFAETERQIGPVRFLDRDAWQFKASIKVMNFRDTAIVTYLGNIFDNMALVGIYGGDGDPSITLLPYINGLKILTEEDND